MNSVHRAVVLCAATMTLSSCKGVESIIVNKSGHDVSVTVLGENQRLLFRGDVSVDTIVDLPERPEQLQSIAYSALGGRLCKILVGENTFRMAAEYGKPTIYLTGC